MSALPSQENSLMNSKASQASSQQSTLPRYLARYVDLGFDSDDIVALINSIDEEHGVTRRPHLPAEILFLILDFVRIDCILGFRLVCRAFKQYIDTHVFYSYLLRTELIGYVGPRILYGPDWILPAYDKISTFRACFSHVERFEEDSRAKWGGNRAVFKLDEAYMNKIEQLWRPTSGDVYNPNTALWATFCWQFITKRPIEYYGMRWFAKIDDAVLPLDSSMFLSSEVRTRMIELDWKKMVMEFAIAEAKVKRKLDSTKGLRYTSGHQDDCVRAVCRERQHTFIDLSVPEGRRLKWTMNTHLRPLFQAPGYNMPKNPIIDHEDDSMKMLLFLRRDAAVGPREREYLMQLAKDREAIFKEMQELDRSVAVWKDFLYDPSPIDPGERALRVTTGLKTRKFTKLPTNPIAWSDKTRRREEQRREMWENQKRTLDQILEITRNAVDLLQLPDDAFDDADDI